MGNLAKQNGPVEKFTSVSEKVVLVVDDNAELLNLLRTILELDGFKVFTALSGKEALAILSETGHPDLILLDMRMKNMSGPDFLVFLEECRLDIIESVPVVFLTAMDTVPPSKAVGFIKKPIEDIDKFVLSVHRFIEGGTGHLQHTH